jgi:V/A-type H+-transporting ATPase subunit C
LGEETAAGTRARALSNRLLSDREYWELLECDSVDEILAELKKTPGYAGLEVPPPGHRAELESSLEGVPFAEAAKLSVSVTGVRRLWLETWIGLYDAETVKRILRKIYSGHEGPSGIKYRFQSVPGKRLPQAALTEARSFQQVLEALRETPWGSVLQEPLKALAHSGGTLFAADMAVDSLALTRLVRASRLFSGPKNGKLADLFGTLADLQNLLWTIRGFRYFDLGFEDMVNRLLPVQHRLRFDTLRKLGRSQDLEELWGHLGRTAYGGILGDRPVEDSLELERRVKTHLWEKARKILRKGFPSFDALGAYLYLRWQEVGDLKMIIEDIRYDYNRREAAFFLARPLLRGGAAPWRS